MRESEARLGRDILSCFMASANERAGEAKIHAIWAAVAGRSLSIGEHTTAALGCQETQPGCF
jgi:hypothetical protein